MTIPWYKAPATEEKAAPGQQEQPCGAAYLSFLSAACFDRSLNRHRLANFIRRLSALSKNKSSRNFPAALRSG